MLGIPRGVATHFQVFSVLSSPDFRKFWIGSLGSVTGFQIFLLAQGWLIYDITGSKLYIGYIGLASGIPAICLNLLGGVIADKINQRKLIVVTQITSSFLMFILATLTLLDMVNVLHMMVISFALGCTQAFDGPTRQALFPRLIDRKDMVNAVALNAMVWQGTRVFGPALGGVIIGTRFGIAPGFYVAFVGFLIMALMMFVLRISPQKPEVSRSFFADMLQGIKFVWNNATFRFLIGMTFFNSIFGMSYVFLLPVFAKDVFDAGTTGLGLLSAFSGIGALLGTFITASLSNYKSRGVLLLTGSVLFGVFLILFSTSGVLFSSLTIGLVLMFLIGVSNSLYMITIMGTLQSLVPNELRGRVMGIYGMTYSMLPLGAMQSGAIAEYTSVSHAVALGGFVVILFAVGMILTNKDLRNL